MVEEKISRSILAQTNFIESGMLKLNNFADYFFIASPVNESVASTSMISFETVIATHTQ
jgi:hypothetical protein